MDKSVNSCSLTRFPLCLPLPDDTPIESSLSLPLEDRFRLANRAPQVTHTAGHPPTKTKKLSGSRHLINYNNGRPLDKLTRWAGNLEENIPFTLFHPVGTSTKKAVREAFEVLVCQKHFCDICYFDSYVHLKPHVF